MRHQKIHPVKNISRNTTKGVIYEQGSYKVLKRFVNFYSYSFDKNIISFDLHSSRKRRPLYQIVENKYLKAKNMKFIVGINTNAFFMAEEGTTPESWSFNLDVKKGVPYQFPVNCRPTILTNKGSVEFKKLNAVGTLEIGNRIVKWKGTHAESDMEAVVYGNFNIPQDRTIQGDKSFITGDYDNAWVEPDRGHLLVSCISCKKGVRIKEISKHRVNLFDSLYVLSVPEKRLSGLKGNEYIGDINVDDLSFNKHISAQSLTTELSVNEDDVYKTFRKYLINKKLSPEYLENYRKSWSLIINIEDKVVFFVVDGRPQQKNQEGLNIYELQYLVSSRYNFENAYISDAGQSSRIVFFDGEKSSIYGNMHYLNYKGDFPVWSGREGRFVPGALLAYNHI